MRASLVVALLLAGCAAGADSFERGGDGGIDASVAPVDAYVPVGEDASAIDAHVPADAHVPIDAFVPLDAAGCPAGRIRCGAECVDLMTDEAHCGACGRICDVPFATDTCLGGTCFVATCDTGRADCNTMASDGCETTCTAGEACTTSCGTTGTRSCASICAPACTPPAEACNARDDDCDGACESGLVGCRAGVHRSQRIAGGHFYTRDRAEAGSTGFLVESYDYYWVYAASAPGLVQLHRCRLASGTYFYSQSAVCEGSAGAVYEGALGWVGASALCGSTPLYRLYRDGDGHFYTVDAGERDSAVSSGYVFEGIEAHVWRAP